MAFLSLRCWLNTQLLSASMASCRLIHPSRNFAFTVWGIRRHHHFLLDNREGLFQDGVATFQPYVSFKAQTRLQPGFCFTRTDCLGRVKTDEGGNPEKNSRPASNEVVG